MEYLETFLYPVFTRRQDLTLRKIMLLIHCQPHNTYQLAICACYQYYLKIGSSQPNTILRKGDCKNILVYFPHLSLFYHLIEYILGLKDCSILYRHTEQDSLYREIMKLFKIKCMIIPTGKNSLKPYPVPNTKKIGIQDEYRIIK